MYGDIHQVIKELILANNGIGVWKVILERAQMHEVNDFESYHYYDDDVSLHLVKAAAQIIGLPSDQFLEQMGDFMVGYTLTRHPLFFSTANNFKRFLQTLNTLFLCLRLSKPGKTVAEFSIEQADSNKELILHYSTNRPWLVQILTGFLKVMAISVYKAECLIKMKQAVDIGGKESNRQHFILSLTSQRAEMEWYKASTMTTLIQTVATNTQGLPSGLVPLLCPYHFVLDRDLNIVTCGAGITKLADLVTGNRKFHRTFRIVWPSVCSSTFEHLTKFKLSRFTLEGRGKQAEFTLKGRMIALQDKQHIIFLGALFLDGLEGFRNLQIQVEDVPQQDGSQRHMMTTELSKRMTTPESEDASELLVKTEGALRRMTVCLEEAELMSGNYMTKYLPPSVGKSYCKGKCVDEHVELVTILCIAVHEFDHLCAACTPEDLHTLLKHLFRVVEAETEDQGAYLLQTSGDAYIVVAGAPDYKQHHREMACNVAVEVMLDVPNIPTPQNVNLKLKMGIHSGSVVSMVLKDTMPRYVMFGDSMHIATELQTTCLPNMIQVSPDTQRLMYKSLGFSFDLRGPVEIEEVHGYVNTHFLTGTPRRGEVAALQWDPSTQELMAQLQKESAAVTAHRKSGCLLL